MAAARATASRPKSRARLGPWAGWSSARGCRGSPPGAGLRTLRLAHPSSRSASTGSNWAARVAGMVPKKTPTEVAAASAMATDQTEMGRS